MVSFVAYVIGLISSLHIIPARVENSFINRHVQKLAKIFERSLPHTMKIGFQALASISLFQNDIHDQFAVCIVLKNLDILRYFLVKRHVVRIF